MNESLRLRYKAVDISDSAFIHKLFSDTDVRTFYVLRDDHSRDLSLFVTYIISAIEKWEALHYIVFKDDTPIGIIGAELRKNFDDHSAWGISYGILSAYRNNGYATEALNTFVESLRAYSIPIALLDVSMENTASEAVARKANFIKRDRIGHFDPEHPELGMLRYWEKTIHPLRDYYFTMGVSAYRNKKYTDAEAYFERALASEYIGGPNSDALCFSNLGIICSSLGKHSKAYKCLRTAQLLGLTNPTIEKELRWLKEIKDIE